MCVCQVESLTAARSAAQAGTEPSDAIRVVNSVLTQLDQIKRSVSLDLCCTFIFKGMLEIRMTIYLIHIAALAVHYSSQRVLQIIVVFHQNIITCSDIFSLLSDAILPSFLNILMHFEIFHILLQLKWGSLCVEIHANLLFPSFRHPNVVILTTSNVTEKIDLAFVDRADIKQYIGPPSASAIFNIYLSCLEELMKVSARWDRLTVEHLRSSAGHHKTDLVLLCSVRSSTPDSSC